MNHYTVAALPTGENVRLDVFRNLSQQMGHAQCRFGTLGALVADVAAGPMERNPVR